MYIIYYYHIIRKSKWIYFIKLPIFELQVVTGDWFWNSIQFQAAAKVATYRWREPGLLSPTNKSVFSPPTPSSVGTSRYLSFSLNLLL